MKIGLFFLVSCFVGSAAVAHPLVDRMEQAAAGKKWEAVAALGGRVIRMEGVDGAALDRAGAIMSDALRADKGARWTEEVKVVSGNTLGGIAKKHGTTVEMVMWLNGLRGPSIRVGQSLYVPRVAFRVEVDKSDNVMDLYAGEDWLRRYVVATGRNNKTPVGVWTITDRVPEPTWWRPSDNKKIPYGTKENELGTHWLAWSKKGFGIHGTWQPESIGSQSSSGCVRMLNAEVVEIYRYLPNGAEVHVRD